MLSLGIPQGISLETAEPIDDISVPFPDQKRLYIQAKRSINFSQGELGAVLQQFAKQHLLGNNETSHYCLVTTSEASKRVTGDLQAAVNAARNCSKVDFERDQPASITSIYKKAERILADVLLPLVDSADLPSTSRAILQKSYVVVLDIDPNSSLEQAVVLILQAARYASPAEMWGKLVADCLDWGQTRKTINIQGLQQTYEHLLVPLTSPAESNQPYLSYKFSAENLSVGRDVVVGRALSDGIVKSGALVVLEMYRFDDNCRHRYHFEGNTLTLANGLRFEIWARHASWTGFNRFAEENADRFDEEVTIVPINADDDFEKGLCASTHRRALEAAAKGRDGSRCVHCGRPVSETMAAVVEFGESSGLTAGLSHKACLLPSDRVMGRADSAFFREYPDLKHFDINSWFLAAHSGNSVLHAAEHAGRPDSPILWGGVPTFEDRNGACVVVCQLKNGTEEIVSKRGWVHRFTELRAEKFASHLREMIADATAKGDPYCYSDQSRTFSTRSILLAQLGAREELHEVVSVATRRYDQRDAARYFTQGSWYAPLLVLREATSSQLMLLTNAVPAISDPLSLGRHLDNWRRAGFDLPSYEIESLLTDDQVDALLNELADTDCGMVIDPILDEASELTLLSGHPVLPISRFDEQSIS